jgi:radical SAM protein with 4Fe4S-binding SPASM domain
VLKASRDLYELRIAKDGEGNEFTIQAGVDYALHLQKANRGGEASELLLKLLASSKQVLGPHHNATKEVESALQLANHMHEARALLTNLLAPSITRSSPCKSCMQAKYCDAECQKKHWATHKADCKRRAAELRDEALFKDPPPKEDCPSASYQFQFV